MSPRSFRNPAHVREVNADLMTLPLPDFLAWAVKTFGDGLVQVTSLGPSGLVVLDHLMRIAPETPVITIDTDFLFPETYALIDAVQHHYAVELDVRRAGLSPEQQTEMYGPRLWEHEPDVCCHVRKVTPLSDALAGRQAWISGLRRDQSSARADTMLVDWDYRHNMVKLNPLALWNSARVWHYIRKHELPYNELHDQNYRSIGCTHCTLAVRNGDERAGRWQGGVKTECGLHINPAPRVVCPE
jgi:phosphoadenosine phosphosulfate reductase